MRLASGLRQIAQGLGVAVLLFMLWWGAKLLFRPADYILPSPWDVIAAIGQPNQRLIAHTGTTFLESALGFIVGNFLAFLAALLFQLNSASRKVLMPVAIALKTTPIVAIAPLLLIWFGPGIHTKIIASALVCFFPMLVGLYEAMAQTPRSMVEYYESLGASRAETVLELRLLYAVPEMFAALRVSSTLAVVGAVVGEMVSATSGLGYVVIASAYSFQTPVTFAAIVLTALCGLLLFLSVIILEIWLGIDRWRS